MVMIDGNAVMSVSGRGRSSDKYRTWNDFLKVRSR